MTMDADIYAAVLRRVAEVDHGWGKPYEFPVLYVLDHAVPAVENSGADLESPTFGRLFDEALRSALRAQLADLPALTFVPTYQEVYDGQRKGPIQVRGGGGFVALGPIYGDIHTASVGVMFYGGHRWVRWLRYHLQRADDIWQIASREVLAVA